MLEDGQVAREIIWASWKAKNSGRQTFGFSSGQMLRSSLILSKPLPLPLGVIFSEWKDRQSLGRFQSIVCLQLAGHGIHQQQSKTHSSPADMGRTWICARTHQNKPVLPCLLGRLQLQYLKPEISFKPFGSIWTLSAVALPSFFLFQLPARKILPLTTLPFQHTQHREQKPTQACLCSWDLSARTHTCRSSMGTQQSVGSTRALAGGGGRGVCAGQQGEQGWNLFLSLLFFYYYCLLF